MDMLALVVATFLSVSLWSAEKWVPVEETVWP
jgi:hypothetical protein